MSSVEPKGAEAVEVKEEGGKGRVLRAKGAVLCPGPWANRILDPMG